MPPKILRSPNDLEAAEIRGIYASFDAPVAAIDCGRMCAPHNPTGKPYCCDILQAVPAVYQGEWDFLQAETDLWHPWQGDECVTVEDAHAEQERILADMPASMLPLACRGPEACQRNYRTLSCRQFPFFPYISEDYRFIGLTYEWAFEPTCWVISHLDGVMSEYRGQFLRTFDWLFAHFQEEFEGYAELSGKMRTVFNAHHRRIPVLHRNGGYYLLDPRSERLQQVAADQLPKFGVYR